MPAATATREVDLGLNYPQWVANQAIGPRRTVMLGWGRGVGKSWFVRCSWWLLIAQWEHRLRTDAPKPFRGVRITVLMPTLTQFKDIHLAGIIDELGPEGDWAFLGGKVDKQRGHIRFPGGSRVMPFPASAYNARTARGVRTDVLCADEFDDIDMAVYDSVAVPWLSEPWSLGIELLAGTPTRGRHGLWWRTRAAGQKGAQLREGLELPELDAKESTALQSIYSFHATYRDAPEMVSETAVEKARATTPEATFRREWEADADAGEGLIYPFDEGFHVAEPPPLERFREFHVGVDFGWVDAGVLLLAGVLGHGEDATLWLLDESYESGVPNHVWDQRAQLMHNACVPYGRATFWPDPSRPERASDFRTMGLTVAEPDNDILAGVGRVAELMFIRKIEGSDERWSRLYISPRCKNLISELGKYRRKKLPDGTFDEMPEDKWNHACDALRYLVMGRFGRSPNYRSVVSGR